MSRRRAAAAASTLALMLAGGCSSSGPTAKNVFAEMPSNGHGSFPARVGEIVDFGISAGKNLTSQPVRITSVMILDPPAGMRVLNARSYRYADSHGVGMIAGIGPLPKECAYYRPHPVDTATAPPHKVLNSYLVVAVTFDQPGSYPVSQARINYLLAGQPGYQVQRIDETVHVTRGAIRHIPSSACH